MKKLSFLFVAINLFAAIVYAQAANEVIISPTFSQAWGWAQDAGNTGWVVFGAILIIGAAGFLIVMRDNFKAVFGLIAAGALAIGLACILSKPLAIKNNNNKKVNKEYLEKVGEKYIWDSLEKHHLIVDGPYK